MSSTILAALESVGSEITRNSGGDADLSIHIVQWRWDELGVLFTFSVFIVICGLAKIAFDHARFLSTHVPESCLMIVVGVTVGAIIYYSTVEETKNYIVTLDKLVRDNLIFPRFTTKMFFFFLLPPVILEAAYSLHDKAFVDNAVTVMLYAVIGTLFNVFAIGLGLYGLFVVGAMGALNFTLGVSYQLTLTDCLVFSTLIAAVDPVAVLAIFQEIGINKDLYYLVFGESLFNDAVTVVLYSTMVVFNGMTVIPGEQYGLAVVAFLVSSLGGLAIGVVYGLLTALITKTTRDCRVVEPLAVLGMAYLSYLSAELFHISGIISIIGCGLVQAHYAFKNVSRKSYTTVIYFTKMISTTSEAIIFLFLGVVVMSHEQTWSTGFVLWSLVLCFVCRFAGVFLLTALANIFRQRRINLKEQFILAYGGLRGAIAFSLTQTLEDSVEPKNLFVTTTLVVIFFTVFVQGSTIKPLVNWLSIKKETNETRQMCEEINENLFDNVVAGIEEILGQRRHSFIAETLIFLDQEFFQKLFLVQTPESDLTLLNKKLFLTDHFAHLYGPAKLAEKQRAEIFRNELAPGEVKMFENPPPAVNAMDLTLNIPMESETRMRSASRASEVFDVKKAGTLRPSFRNHPRDMFPGSQSVDEDPDILKEHLLLQRHVTARRISHMVERPEVIREQLLLHLSARSISFNQQIQAPWD